MSVDRASSDSASQTVAVVIGSLRRESLTRRVASAIVGLAPSTLSFRFIEIGDLPLYNEDREVEGQLPNAWANFRTEVSACDAVMFATPEYNRSVPGVLKNALDVGSRPFGRSVWDGKPAAIVSVSPGALGAFGANHHLRQSLVFLNMPTMQQPEAYVGHAATLWIGSEMSASARQFLEAFGARFERWIGVVTSVCQK